MKFRTRLGLFVCTAAFLAAGCDTQREQDDFAAQASAPPSGYTQTNEDGEVIDADPDDWRTAPVFAGRVRIEPAYPNPTGGGFVTIPVTVSQFEGVRGFLILRGRSAGGGLVTLDEIPDAGSPGSYIFTFSPGLLGRSGLVRLFIFDGTGEIVSYGDLLIQ